MNLSDFRRTAKYHSPREVWYPEQKVKRAIEKLREELIKNNYICFNDVQEKQINDIINKIFGEKLTE
jgi:hypothetical protein